MVTFNLEDRVKLVQLNLGDNLLFGILDQIIHLHITLAVFLFLNFETYNFRDKNKSPNFF